MAGDKVCSFFKSDVWWKNLKKMVKRGPIEKKYFPPFLFCLSKNKQRMPISKLHWNRSKSEDVKPEAKFKEFQQRLKFESRLKYGWFRLKLYSMFQDFSRR